MSVSLRGRLGMPDHAFGDRCLGDLDPKLEKFATIWSPRPSPSSDKAEIFHELRRPSVVRRRPIPLQTVLKPRLPLDVALVVSVPVQLHRGIAISGLHQNGAIPD